MAKHIKKQCIGILKGILKHSMPYSAGSLYLDMVSECVSKGVRIEDIVQEEYFIKKWLPKEKWLELYYDAYLKGYYYQRCDDPRSSYKKSRIGQLVDKMLYCINGVAVCRK